jgi:hypothetical protein
VILPSGRTPHHRFFDRRIEKRLFAFSFAWRLAASIVSLPAHQFRQRHAHFKSPKGNELTAMKIYTTPVAPPVFLNRSGVLRYQFSKAWQFLNFVPRQPFA